MKRFLDTRCSMQRLSDGSFHYGWVKEVHSEELRIMVAKESDLSVGDVCELMLSSTAGAATFKGSVRLTINPDIIVTLPQRIMIDKANAGARMKVQGIGASVAADGASAAAEVADVSDGGISVITTLSVDPGVIIELHLDTPYGSIDCPAKVVHCQFKEQGEAQLFRLGLSIEKLGRIEHARWSYMIGKRVA